MNKIYLVLGCSYDGESNYTTPIHSFSSKEKANSFIEYIEDMKDVIIAIEDAIITEFNYFYEYIHEWDDDKLEKFKKELEIKYKNAINKDNFELFLSEESSNEIYYKITEVEHD